MKKAILNYLPTAEQVADILLKPLEANIFSNFRNKHGFCYALLSMRPLSIPCAECSVVISCGKVDYDKSGWRTIEARCSDCVWVIVGFRGVRLDPDETPDDRKLTGFE
jgi:hypothetical protein